jgi:hypothetical protein
MSETKQILTRTNVVIVGDQITISAIYSEEVVPPVFDIEENLLTEDGIILETEDNQNLIK